MRDVEACGSQCALAASVRSTCFVPLSESLDVLRCRLCAVTVPGRGRRRTRPGSRPSAAPFRACRSRDGDAAAVCRVEEGRTSSSRSPVARTARTCSAVSARRRDRRLGAADDPDERPRAASASRDDAELHAPRIGPEARILESPVPLEGVEQAVDVAFGRPPAARDPQPARSGHVADDDALLESLRGLPPGSPSATNETSVAWPGAVTTLKRSESSAQQRAAASAAWWAAQCGTDASAASSPASDGVGIQPPSNRAAPSFGVYSPVVVVAHLREVRRERDMRAPRGRGRRARPSQSGPQSHFCAADREVVVAAPPRRRSRPRTGRRRRESGGRSASWSSSTGSRLPVCQETCESASRRVFGADLGEDRLQRRARAGSSRIRATRTRAPEACSGPSRPKCSVSVVTTSSSGPRPQPGERRCCSSRSSTRSARRSPWGR